MVNQKNSSADKVALGGYILEDCSGSPEIIFIGTGSELNLCVEAAKEFYNSKWCTIKLYCGRVWDAFIIWSDEMGHIHFLRV